MIYALIKHCKGAAKLQALDYAERRVFVKGIVITHDLPLARIQSRNAYRYRKDNELFIAAEGTYTGQYLYCGKKLRSRMHTFQKVQPLHHFAKVQLQLKVRPRVLVQFVLRHGQPLAVCPNERQRNMFMNVSPWQRLVAPSGQQLSSVMG